VKNLARLALFFSLSFAALFLVSAALRYLHIRIDGVRILPLQPRMPLADFVAAARWALPLTAYFSLLFGLSYASRINAGSSGGGRPLSAPPVMICLLVLSLAFTGGLSLGLERTGVLVPARDLPRSLGGPGLLLTQGGTTIVLLRGPGENLGPRVAAIPGQPLIYQEQPLGPDNTALSVPPLPLRKDSPWFLRSIAIDFSLTGGRFEALLKDGFIPFLIYGGALFFFLVSLGFILKLSKWPLANLFAGALAFRGVLTLETFLNSPEIQELFASFLGNRLPLSFMVPLIFCSLGVLVNLYTFLVYLAKRRADEED
jgi:hypothetical protein